MGVTNKENLKVDVPLTNFSLEQPQGTFVFSKIPELIIPVQKISDKVRVRANDKFRLQELIRTGKAGSNGIDREEGTPIVYSCEERALHDVVTKRDADNVDAPIQLLQESVSDLTNIVNLRLEKDVADILRAASLYGSNTSAIVTKWDASSSTPYDDIDIARRAMWNTAKVRPNYLILPYEVAVY